MHALRRPGKAGQVLRALLILLALLAPWAAGATDSHALRGEWRAVDDQTAAWQPFDPSRLQRIPRGPAGAEIRLWPLNDAWPQEQVSLVVQSPGLQRYTWFPPDGAQPVTAHLWQTSRQGWSGHGRIAFELPSTPPPGQPLRLRLEPQGGINSSAAFVLQSRQAHLAADARWLALVSTCLAMLAGMAAIALVFMVRLRDVTFLFYAGYLLGYAMIQLLQTGYVASPLGWTVIAEAPRAWGRVAVSGSILMAVLFLIRFAALRVHLPRSERPLLWYAAAIALSAVLGFLPVPALQTLASALINPLLIIGGPLLLTIAVLAWRRGSRYAGFFIVGWTPLLVLTVAGSLQLFGLWETWLWSNEAALVAAAFEALVLSAGLADRAALVRRDRDVALALADLDPLTGLLNRRAFEPQLLQTVAASHLEGQPLCLMFCDLDNFKRLNDSQGHAGGDLALQAISAELRRGLRAPDRMGRFGGEEFVILAPGLGVAAGRALAERLRERVAHLGRPPRFGDSPLTISIGLAALMPAEDSRSLLARADAALYAAKRGGRNRVCVAADAGAGQPGPGPTPGEASLPRD